MRLPTVCVSLAAVVLTGCTNPLGANVEVLETPTASAATSPNPQESDSERGTTPQPSPEPSADLRRGIRECPGPIAAEARAVIEAQLAEFATRSFKRARQYASDEFRRNVPLDQFQEIIVADYPFLLDDPQVSFSGCVERDGKAYLQVAVTSDTVRLLTYRLVRDPDDSLAIDAANIIAVSLDQNA